jgi:proteasome lid subunit RPN8/RPN11
MARKDEVEKAREDKKEEKVQTGGWDDNVKIRSRTFNGPAAAHDPLRIAMTKEAYADLIGHAKESLDNEICGVLLGDLCEDEYGRFIDIQAALRGGAARSKGTSVTFTQETWNEIHKAKEERYPRLQIVGWYHSHPGFGVEFSDMDRFIQQNFFSGPGQIAFVTDPLGGEEAIDANIDGRLAHVERFWVDGRERRCYVPAGAKPASHAAGSTEAAKSGGASIPGDLSKRLDDLQDRIRQLTDIVEKQRSWFYNLCTTLGMMIAVVAIVALGFYLWWGYSQPPIPSRVLGSPWTVQTPLAGPDGKPVIVTMEARGITVPAAMQAEMLQNLVMSNRKEVAALLKAMEELEASTRPAASGSAPATAPASAPRSP